MVKKLIGHPKRFDFDHIQGTEQVKAVKNRSKQIKKKQSFNKIFSPATVFCSRAKLFHSGIMPPFLFNIDISDQV